MQFCAGKEARGLPCVGGKRTPAGGADRLNNGCFTSTSSTQSGEEKGLLFL